MSLDVPMAIAFLWKIDAMDSKIVQIIQEIFYSFELFTFSYLRTMFSNILSKHFIYKIMQSMEGTLAWLDHR